MPVVKAQQQQRSTQSAIVLDLGDLEREAGEIVRRARAEAARILAEAKAQAEAETVRIKEAARAAGHQEGFDAGMAAGQQAGHDEAVQQAAAGLQGLVDRWSRTLDELENGMPVHGAEIKTDLVKLAMGIAAKVTKMEALRNQDVVRANTEAALGLVGEGRKVTITVHPDELSVVEGYVPGLMEKFRQVTALDVKGDETLTPGSTVLRFGGGEVDGRLETQMERIAIELLAGQ